MARVISSWRAALTSAMVSFVMVMSPLKLDGRIAGFMGCVSSLPCRGHKKKAGCVSTQPGHNKAANGISGTSRERQELEAVDQAREPGGGSDLVFLASELAAAYGGPHERQFLGDLLRAKGAARPPTRGGSIEDSALGQAQHFLNRGQA